jgi:Leucine-rich repeat (LRR) protein
MQKLILLLAFFSKMFHCAAGGMNLQTSQDPNDACSLCNCYMRNSKQYVDCTLASVTSMPTNIPLNTSRLWLSGQNLSDIGYSNFLPHLPRLRELHLNGNPIASISPNAFENVTGLRTLLLHYTSITILPDDLFANMTRLRYLWINNALVNTVGPNTFRGLPLLQSLRLQGNDISEFAEGQFFDLPNIHELDIRSNNDSLAPSCCDLCGVSPSALQMHYSNNSVLHKDDSGIYSLRCGTR